MSTGAVSTREPAISPRVWLLMGHKSGDNQQVLALAEALGWPFEIKRFAYKPTELWSNLMLGPNLLGVDRKASSDLAPPWPDLVITAGRRNEPVARWIQRQAGEQRVRLVHIGRPWAPLRYFDLVVSTPQYQLPGDDNVVVNPLPLHRVSAERLEAAAAEWQDDLAGLPRPVTALLVGGNSGPYLFDLATAERLANLCNDQVAREGGSLVITTSARTPAEVVGFLSRAFTGPHLFQPWRAGQARNPYFALLALAQAIIVTGDSTSMLTEATSTGKPVYIFGFGRGSFAMKPEDRDQPAFYPGDLFFWRPGRWKAFLSHLVLRIGPKRLIRDIRRLQGNLIADGRAAWLGDSQPPGGSGEPDDALARAQTRVRNLFEPSADSRPADRSAVPGGSSSGRQRFSE